MQRKRFRNFRVTAVRLIVAAAFIAVPGRLTAEAAGGGHSAASAFALSAWDAGSLGGINPHVFAAALEAAASAVEKGLANDPSTLTVIDFTRPSTEKRLWVFDVRTHALLFYDLVSHGRGSGKTMATAFSNDALSNMSSLGLYRTAETYVGHNGYSLRLDGLDRGLNDNARVRAIVVHGAPYVNAATAKANGYLGRSLGCPAVRPEIAHQLIDTIKGGGLLFAFGTPAR
jgi:L,D-transpeptidase-like protein